MRSPQYQIGITEDSVKSWIRKFEHSVRALKDDEKKGIEWEYLHLVNLQDDMAYLDKFIEQLLIIRLMRDSDEYPAPVSQQVEELDSKSGQ